MLVLKLNKFIGAGIIFLLPLFGFCQKYYAYVAAESEDEVSLIEFDSKTASAKLNIPVGVWPAEMEGPHGVGVSSDGKHWFVSMAHGNPYGTLYKYSTETNQMEGQVKLGLFPATMAISKLNGLMFCVNFDLHGDMSWSSVSVIDPETMTEIKKITTGSMPHGSRISPDGKFHYSVAMMSGLLFEINTLTLEVSRILDLDENTSLSPDDYFSEEQLSSNSLGGNHQHNAQTGVKPTWASPHPTLPILYVAGNGSDEILKIDLKTWKIVDRLKGGKAPYNLDITPDGKYLVASYKAEGSTGVWNIKKGEEVARIKNSTTVTHGVAISSDSKFAFISVEGKGGEPGKVDIIDLQKMERVADVAIGKQAGGIIFWKKAM